MYYTTTVLPKIIDATQKVGKRLLLHHDNASSHMAHKTQDFLRENHITVLPHPPYSPDLAPLDFWVFPKLKEALHDRKFLRIQDLAQAINQLLKAHPEQWYADCMQTWMERLQQCVHVNGEYIERLR